MGTVDQNSNRDLSPNLVGESLDNAQDNQSSIDTIKDTGQQPKKKVNRADFLKPYQYKKGQSGNPSGRPKGSKSLKEYAKEMLRKMTDEEREEFLHGLNKDIIWEMAEGKAPTILQGDAEKPIIIKLANEIAEQNEIDPNTSDSSKG